MKINPIGGHLFSVKLHDSYELLYLSPIKIDGIFKRGGIPILFPQFGNLGSLTKHGFARDLFWEEVSMKIKGDEISYKYILDNNQKSNSIWEFDYKVILTFCLVKNKTLSIKMQVLNLGEHSFSFTGGLHPYFAINCRKNLKINGLQGVDYIDTDPMITSFDLNSCDGIERLFLSNCDLEFFNGFYNLKLSISGFENWMIWNPGKNGAIKIIDLPDNDFDKFICIEPVIANKSIMLESGQSFQGELIIRMI